LALKNWGVTINELYDVLGEEFMSDDVILSQKFMRIEDSEDVLKDYRTLESTTTVDTKNLTAK
jgi:hypothetical protein